MTRSFVLLGLIALGACSDDASVDPGEKSGCDVACGAGFECKEAKCVLDPATTITAELLSPVADAILNSTDVQFSCRVNAPQVSAVFARVAATGTDPVEHPLEREAGKDTWKATALVAEGAHEVSCVVEFGPASSSLRRESEKVSFSVETGDFPVALKPLDGWYGAVAAVRVEARDTEARGLSATLAFKSPLTLIVDGKKDSEGVWGFDFNVEQLLTGEPVERALDFVVTVKDAAGNRGLANGALRVDTVNPVVSIDFESDWVRAGGETVVEVTAIEDGELSQVRLTTGDKSYAGVLTADKWVFRLPVSTLAPDGYEGLLPYVVEASDAAGNQAVAGSDFRIDTVAPSVSSDGARGWFDAGATALVKAAVVEGYAVRSATLAFDYSTFSVQGEDLDGGEWVFRVDVDSLAGGPMESMKGYEIVFADVAGNESRVSGVLGVDNVAPTITTRFESAWLPAGATAKVSVEVVEGGAIASVVLAMSGRSFPGTRVGSLWEFALPVSELLPSSGEGTVPYVVTVVDGAGHQASVKGSLGFDAVAPTIDVTPLPEWVRRDSTLTVEATIADGVAVSASTVFLEMGGARFEGVAGQDETWSFEVPLGDTTEPTVEGPVAVTITAQDLAGNIGSTAFDVNVDATPPSATVTGNPDAAWRGPTPFPFTATLAYTGAPVVSAKLRGAGGVPVVERSGSAASLSLNVDPAAWQASNKEGNVPWTLTVTDAAGNEVVRSGAFKIDLKAPLIVTNASSSWFGGTTVTVSPGISDGGSGVSASGVAWKTTGQSGKCTVAGAVWNCPVATPLAAGHVNPAYPFTITASDIAGNQGAVNGMLKIDRMGPSLSFVPDGKWYGRGANIVVKVIASDEHSGLAPVAPTLEILSPLASTHPGTLVSGIMTFSVPASSVVAAGQSSTAVKLRVTFEDLAGNASTIESTTQFKVDDTPPTVSTSVSYPSGRDNVATRDPFGERAKAVVEVTAADNGSGLSGVSLYRDAVEYAMSSSSGNTYRFTVDFSAIDGLGGAGYENFTAIATDAVGKSSNATQRVYFSRSLWSKGYSSYPPVGGLALGGGRLFLPFNVLGSSDYNLYSIDRANGNVVWKAKVDGKPTTAVTVGEQYSKLYPVVASDSAGGTISVFSSDQSSSTATPSTKISGIGQARGALAFSMVSWAGTASGDSAKKPTVFVAGADDYLRALTFNCLLGLCDTMGQPASALFSGASYWTAPAMAGNVMLVGSSDGRVGKGTKKKMDLGAGNYEYKITGATTTLNAGDPVINGLALDIFGGAWVVRSGGAEYLDFNMNWTSPVSSPHTGQATALVRSSSSYFFGVHSGGVYYRGSNGFVKSSAFSAAMKAAPMVGRDASGSEMLYAAEGGTFRALTVGTAAGVWAVSIGSNLEVAPVLDCNGIAYVADNNGAVHAIVTDSIGLSKSNWPRFQHDNRNSGDANYKTWNGNTCID